MQRLPQVPGQEGNISGGLSGPTLVGASTRLNPDWIYAYLANSKTFKPFRDMPDFAGPLSDAQLQQIAAFVANFE